MKLFALCCLLILGLLSCLPTPGEASPSRHTGPGSGPRNNGSPFSSPQAPPRPIIYDSPVGPRPKTMYA
ncbi:immune-induced peptide 18 [Drosophila ficusphila]|uniref:immune-induced peptide 18 n=1 Tax=Drosophila ficusphila TaxID=30025 RepID=UPI0007E7AE77|nr:immune-induced peptide 18 [Drosophila ficusphila]